jgi:hypothetical protein
MIPEHIQHLMLLVWYKGWPLTPLAIFLLEVACEGKHSDALAKVLKIPEGAMGCVFLLAAIVGLITFIILV